MSSVLRVHSILRALLSSRFFFYGVIGIFILSSLWVAFASIYPMAFDEDFHMGLIRIYAGYLLPYGIEMTSEMATYGAAAADPSYLFHHLLSFPYRLLDALGFSEIIIIMILRIMNIAFAAASLVVFHRGIKRAGVSTPITNLALALFTMVPILPLMAGQVNYDNLLLLVVAICLYITVGLTKEMQTKKQVPLRSAMLLIGWLLVGAAIKYAFLPIALGIAIWLIAVYLRTFKKEAWLSTLLGTFRSIRKLAPRTRVWLIAFVLLGVFFCAKYAVNKVEYGNFIPPCDTVFDETACRAYGPWNRNYLLKQNLSDSFDPISFPAYMNEFWLPDMAQRLTFAVAGPSNDYQTKPPVPLVRNTFVILVTLGAICLSIAFVFIIRSYPVVGLSVLVTLIYIVPLAWKLYKSYVMTGEAVAINGRYLLPLLPFITASMIIAALFVLRKLKLQVVGSVVAVACLVLLIIGGGGVGTYIRQAEAHWFHSGWGQTSYRFLHEAYPRL